MKAVELRSNVKPAKDFGSKEYNLRAILVIIYAFKLYNESSSPENSMKKHAYFATAMYLGCKNEGIHTQVRLLARYVFYKRHTGSKLLRNTYDEYFDKKAEYIQILIEKM